MYSCARSGADVIHDRIAFAGANWKPLLELRQASARGNFIAVNGV